MSKRASNANATIDTYLEKEMRAMATAVPDDEAASQFLRSSAEYREALQRLLKHRQNAAVSDELNRALVSMAFGDTALRCAQRAELTLTHLTVEEQRRLLDGTSVDSPVALAEPGDAPFSPQSSHETALVHAIDRSNRLYQRAAILSAGYLSSVGVAIAQLALPAQ